MENEMDHSTEQLSEEYQALAKVIRESDDVTLEVLHDHSAAIVAALREELLTQKGKPFSLRLSEETSRSIEAEARLTRRTMSAVIKDRMIFGLIPEKERDPHLRDRRRLMASIVEMSFDGLFGRVEFLRGLIERAQSPQAHIEEELRLYQTEIALRAKEGRHDEEIARTVFINKIVAEKIRHDEHHRFEG